MWLRLFRAALRTSRPPSVVVEVASKLGQPAGVGVRANALLLVGRQGLTLIGTDGVEGPVDHQGKDATVSFLGAPPRGPEVEVGRVGDLAPLGAEVTHRPDLGGADVDARAEGEDDARAVRRPVWVGVAAPGRGVVGEPDRLC